MIAHETASSHKGDVEDRATASGHREPPDERGNAHADDAIGSGQKTATGHAESGLGETGFPENESARAESGSVPNIATARGRTETEKMTASDALDREREEERERGRRPRELSDRERALRFFRISRSEERDTREDRARERSSETSPNSPRRGACCDEWGEATKEASQAGGVRHERATSSSLASEGAEETEAHLRDTDEHPETPPPPSR